jgi:chromosome segregation ATPase
MHLSLYVCILILRIEVLVYNIYEMVTPKKIIIKDLELADEEIARLRKENKELIENSRYYKTKSEFLNKVIVKYQEENEELKEKIDTLELCIKNKDELLEEYRKKIDKLRTDNIYEE